MFDIASQRYQLQGAGYSQKGGRPENQDNMSYLETPFGYLLLVCDGMGGGPGGRTASQLAIKAFVKAIGTFAANAPCTVVLREATAAANSAVEQAAASNPVLKGMGSTLVALLVNRHAAYVAHLGDSRCYKLRGRSVVFRTQDHSLVAELVRNKTLTEEQARTSPQANVISRALGATSRHEPDVTELAYRKGDRFLLCTDGVWGMMPARKLVKSVTRGGDLSSVCADLSTRIEQTGHAAGSHHDNHTLALIEMKTNSTKTDPMTPKQKLAFAILSLLLAVSLVANLMTCKHTDDAVAEIPTGTETIATHTETTPTSKETTSATAGIASAESGESAMLLHVIDSLNRRITELESHPLESTKLPGSPESSGQDKPAVTTAPTPQPPLSGKFIALCDSMLHTSLPTQQAAVNRQAELVQKLHSLTTQMEQDGTGDTVKAAMRDIQAMLNSSTLTLVMRDAANTHFVPTEPAKTQIKKIKQKMASLMPPA